MSSSDGEIVERASRGEKAAADELVRRYFKQIGVFVYQKLGPQGDWEDILQDIFARALRSLGQVRQPERFGAWLYSVAASVCTDFVRAKSRRPAPSPLEGAAQQAAAQDGQRIERETLEAVRAAIAELPDDYRVAVTLRFLEGMSAKAIAEFLGEPAGTVRNRIFRANRMLEEKLRKFLE